VRDSAGYLEQAEMVMRLAAKAQSQAEKDVYISIAEGWRRLAAEADRNAGHVDEEPRSFRARE
jgi:hypothetical protein